MKDFRSLKVWEKAHCLTLAVYKASGRFPRQELFGLTSQMRRCSASIGANIAEGCGKRRNNEFQRYLQARLANSIIICCWHATWDSWRKWIIGDSGAIVADKKNAHVFASESTKRSSDGLNAKCQLLTADSRISSLP
jgi:hypothetical protein